jgi:hypothetical protein
MVLNYLNSLAVFVNQKKKSTTLCCNIGSFWYKWTQILSFFRMHELTKLTNQFTNTKFKIEKESEQKIEEDYIYNRMRD